jgi:hypothetical protein
MPQVLSAFSKAEEKSTFVTDVYDNKMKIISDLLQMW